MAKENIYKFTVNKEETTKVETKRKNRKTGEEEIILKSKKIQHPHEFLVKKPTRRMVDDAEVQYAIELSKEIKRGIVTKAMLVKQYADTGGPLANHDAKELINLLQKSNELTSEYQLLKGTDSDNPRLGEVETELLSVRRRLADMEQSLQGVYQHTADARAERALMMWYLVQLSRKVNEKGEEEEFFEGEGYAEKLDKLYERSEEEDEFFDKVLETLMKVVSVWFYSQTTSQEEIDKILEPESNSDEGSS